MKRWIKRGLAGLLCLILAGGAGLLAVNGWVKRGTAGRILSPEEAAEHPEVTPNGTPPFDNFIKVYVPSTLQKTGYGAFCGMIGYVYMNWLTDPAQFPSQWDVGTFASAYVRQVFFPQETIDAHMAALDALVSAFDRVDEVAYYDEGTTSAYWVDATESGS